MKQIEAFIPWRLWLASKRLLFSSPDEAAPACGKIQAAAARNGATPGRVFQHPAAGAADWPVRQGLPKGTFNFLP